MDELSNVSAPLSYAAGGFLFLGAIRATVNIFGMDIADKPDVFKRRWIEVGVLIGIAIILAILAVLFRQ